MYLPCPDSRSSTASPSCCRATRTKLSTSRRDEHATDLLDRLPFLDGDPLVRVPVFWFRPVSPTGVGVRADSVSSTPWRNSRRETLQGRGLPRAGEVRHHPPGTVCR